MASATKQCRSAINVDSDESSWTDIDNYTDSYDNTVCATSSLDKTSTSDILRAYNFDFDIPSGSTIDGIEVVLKTTGGSANVTYELVQLYGSAGTLIGDNYSTGAILSAEYPEYTDFGSNTDLWGTSWSIDDINDSDFGVGLAAYNASSASQSAEAYDVKITVYYTEPIPDVLSSTDITTGASAVEIPTFGQEHILLAQGISTPGPLLENPAINQAHNLSIINVFAQLPEISAPVINQEHKLFSQEIETQPAIDSPSLGQTHPLASTEVTTQSPKISVPDLAQRHILIIEGICSQHPVISSMAIGQSHNLTATSMGTQEPIIEAPVIGHSYSFSPINIQTQIPVIGLPAIAQVHELSSINILFQAPVIGSPSIGEGGNFRYFIASSIEAKPPVVANSIICQIHNLGISNTLARSPTIGIPRMASYDTSGDVTRTIAVKGDVRYEAVSNDFRAVVVDVGHLRIFEVDNTSRVVIIKDDPSREIKVNEDPRRA